MRRITATLEIRPRVDGEVDRYGNPKRSYGPPVPWPVFAVAPRPTEEPGEAARDVVISGLQVFAPIDGPEPGPHDRVGYNGVTYEVIGEVARWDNNPHFQVTTQRGIVVNLERSEG